MYGIFKKTGEKVEKAVEETSTDAKKTLHKTNALIDESSDKIKTIATVMVIGFTLSSLASIASIVVSLKQGRNLQQPKVVNQIYIEKEGIIRHGTTKQKL